MEIFVLSHANVLRLYPKLCLQVGSPLGPEPTWQTSMLYSDIVPLIYVNENKAQNKMQFATTHANKRENFM